MPITLQDDKNQTNRVIVARVQRPWLSAPLPLYHLISQFEFNPITDCAGNTKSILPWLFTCNSTSFYCATLRQHYYSCYSCYTFYTTTRLYSCYSCYTTTTAAKPAAPLLQLLQLLHHYYSCYTCQWAVGTIIQVTT